MSIERIRVLRGLDEMRWIKSQRPTIARVQNRSTRCSHQCEETLQTILTGGCQETLTSVSGTRTGASYSWKGLLPLVIQGIGDFSSLESKIWHFAKHCFVFSTNRPSLKRWRIFAPVRCNSLHWIRLLPSYVQPAWRQSRDRSEAHCPVSSWRETHDLYRREK